MATADPTNFTRGFIADDGRGNVEYFLYEDNAEGWAKRNAELTSNGNYVPCQIPNGARIADAQSLTEAYVPEPVETPTAPDAPSYFGTEAASAWEQGWTTGYEAALASLKAPATTGYVETLYSTQEAADEARHEAEQEASIAAHERQIQAEETGFEAYEQEGEEAFMRRHPGVL